MTFDMTGANAAFLSTFGVSAIYEQPPESPFTVTVIEGTPNNIEPMDPGFKGIWVRLSDFTTQPAAGDLVTIGSTSYQVFKAHAEEQSGGGAWLTLQRMGDA